jgi:hypothetical protein
MSTQITFKQFLDEAMIDVDVTNPQQAQQDVRKAAQIAKASPERLNRELSIKAKEEQQQAAASEGPTKMIDMQIAKKKQELAMLMRRRDGILKQTQSSGQPQ